MNPPSHTRFIVGLIFSAAVCFFLDPQSEHGKKDVRRSCFQQPQRTYIQHVITMQNAPILIGEITEKDKARFWKKVRVVGADECWLWTATRHVRGYGLFDLRGKQMRSNRIAWVLSNGPIGDLHVLHRCDNPPCCNPSHLFLGTHADNMRDKALKGRAPALIGDLHPSKTHPECLVRGEAHPKSKLSSEIVIEMRQRFANGESAQKLGREFGVAKSSALRAISGKNWTHIA